MFKYVIIYIIFLNFEKVSVNKTLVTITDNHSRNFIKTLQLKNLLAY